MTSFIDLHKVVIRRRVFSTFPNAWNGVELEGGAENESGFEFTKNPSRNH
jgi:hypothetical protein